MTREMISWVRVPGGRALHAVLGSTRPRSVCGLAPERWKERRKWPVWAVEHKHGECKRILGRLGIKDGVNYWPPDEELLVEKRMNHQCCDRKQLCIATDSYQCSCSQCRPETKIKCFHCDYVFMTENEVDYEQASEGLPSWWALDDADLLADAIKLTPEELRAFQEEWNKPIELPLIQVKRGGIQWPVQEQREGE